MKIVVVDDEMTVQHIEYLIREISPHVEIMGFIDTQDAIEYLSKNKAEVVILDLECDKYNGIDLAKICKELCPRINIIVISEYLYYLMEAFQLRVSGYLMKPIRADELRMEFENLRYPSFPESYNRVRVQTFGNFEIFVEGKPIKFSLIKCKECLAYLIDRKGALVTVAELAAVLWEDKPFDKALRNSIYQVISKMIKVLKEKGVEEIVIKYPREIGVDISKINCDYYRVLTGDTMQMCLFLGEYMNNYSWAEFTLGALIKRKKEI